ncbi:hypothetical protein WJX72_009791 [[Myrmecia] bisecta]|uniref:Uncharacterized protein n=1 Tax=[Myrmecia] bisecta TaxID=41462 RepID=A0AAW1PTI5_9CHLO
MTSSSRALVLPITRRIWLLHAVTETEAAARAGPPTVTQKVVSKLHAQWETFSNAQPGTLKGWLYRLAQKVQSYEPPEETFLKGLPSRPQPVDITHAQSTAETLVRRRIRLLLRNEVPQHRRQTVTWGLGAAVFVPLLLTPLPNIPLYYSAWRVYSHFTAYRGGSTLESMLEELATEQLLELRQQLLKTGRKDLPEDSWPAQLVNLQGRYASLMQNTLKLANSSKEHPDLIFTSSPSLDTLLASKPDGVAATMQGSQRREESAAAEPSRRDQEPSRAGQAGSQADSSPGSSPVPAPLDEATIAKIANTFHMPSLVDHARRARQQWAKKGCLPPAV